MGISKPRKRKTPHAGPPPHSHVAVRSRPLPLKRNPVMPVTVDFSSAAAQQQQPPPPPTPPPPSPPSPPLFPTAQDAVVGDFGELGLFGGGGDIERK